MATSSYDSIFNFGTTAVIVPVGATLGVYIDNLPGENNLMFEMRSGGTCWIVGSSMGTTQTPASLAAIVGTGAITSNAFLMHTDVRYIIEGAPRFYLCGTAATCIIQFSFGLSQGF